MNQYHVSGDVVVEFVVDKSGNAINPVVLHSSNPAFDESAINAVLRWKFKPATKNGKPVNKEATQDIRFEPADSPTPLMQFDVTPATRDEPGTSRPVVTGTYPIVYPYELERTNVTGRAKARMLLSETGRVISVKIVSCSQPEFGFALAAAVQGFRYSPAQKDGIPVPSIMEMDQVFDSEQLSAPETRRLFFMDQHKGAVHVVAELDAPPHPLSIRRPLYPSALLGTGITGDASVEFLIQEDGWVRLPRIVQASRPEFGYAAVEAVASWAFEPPRVHGKPVVARARVSFRFKPKPSEAAGH
jgi:TonB family protein